MSTNQPSNAPPTDAPRPTDDLTAAAVLRDDTLDQPVGGGGLGGAGAASSSQPSGAGAPNSPIDAELPIEAGDATAPAEARTRAVRDAPTEPGHTSA